MEASRTLARVDSSGLTEAEAAARLAERGSSARPATSRSYSSIVRANTLTVFNAILAFFGTLTLVFGDWRDALFLGILAANTAIGIGQEVRAKRALDRLAALVAPTGKVVRDGLVHPVPVDQVVVGDLVRLDPGDQVIADGTRASADGVALDESNLTGESIPWSARPASVCTPGRSSPRARANSSSRRAAPRAGRRVWRPSRARSATSARPWCVRWIVCCSAWPR